MNWQWTNVPMEVVFNGCRADPRTVDLCLEVAGALGPQSRRIESCEVVVTDRGLTREVRVDIRTAEGEVIVDRFMSSQDETRLRSALRQAFARIAQHIERMREVDAMAARRSEPPPCIWQG